MARKTNSNKASIDLSTNFQSIKDCKERYGKSESTLRNLVREWRKGKHQGNIIENGGRLFFKTSWLDHHFTPKASAPINNLPPKIDERTLAILEKQLDEKDAQIERLQIMLAQKEENLKNLLQSPPQKKRWWQRTK
jgi:hypothetical protein